jgi:hypothetical protein
MGFIPYTAVQNTDNRIVEQTEGEIFMDELEYTTLEEDNDIFDMYITSIQEKQKKQRSKASYCYNTYSNNQHKKYPSKKKGHQFMHRLSDGYIKSNKHGVVHVKVSDTGDKETFICSKVPYVKDKTYEYYSNGEITSSISVGIHGSDLPPIKLPMSLVSNQNYLADHFDHDTIIANPKLFGMTVQCMAAERDVHRIYKYTGFTDNFDYVHSGGVISQKKMDNTHAELDSGSLTIEHVEASPKECTDALDGLFKLEPVTTLMVSFQLLSLTYSKYGSEVPGFVFLLWGSSGTFKSSLSCHIFGIFKEYYNTAPINLKIASSAVIPRMSRLFRDCTFSADDAAPSNDGNGPIYEKCEGITRANGDKTGRSIVGKDGKPDKYTPVGMSSISGEFVPFRNASDIGRCVMYRVSKGAIQPDRLAEVQKHKPEYIRFITDYIGWICRRKDKYIAEITDLHIKYRDKLKEYSKIHSRTPDNLSWLYASFDMLCKYTGKYYSASKKKQDQWRSIFKTAVERSIHEQKEYTKQQNEADMFIDTINKMLRSKITDLTPIMKLEKNKKTARETSATIGYYDDEHVYLKPEEAYAKTDNWLHSIQSGYSLPLQALLNLLKEQKYLKTDSDGRPKTRLTLNGVRMRVIKIKRKHFNIPNGRGQTDQAGKTK